MFKKLCILVLAFNFLVVSAEASTQASLKEAFDSLNYSLSVEWDQSDKDFYAQEVNRFISTVSTLRAQGMTNDEMIRFLQAEIKDQGLALDIENMLQTISINKMNSDEINQYVVKSLKQSYGRGANWTDLQILAVILPISAILGVALAFALAQTDLFLVPNPYYVPEEQQ